MTAELTEAYSVRVRPADGGYYGRLVVVRCNERAGTHRVLHETERKGSPAAAIEAVTAWALARGLFR